MHMAPEPTSMQAAIKKHLADVDDNFIGLVIVDPERFHEASMELVKHLSQEKNLPGIYIAGNQGYEALTRHFQKNQVDTQRITFIDCVTEKPAGEGSSPSVNPVLVGSLEQLTELEIELQKALKRHADKNHFVLLDSITTFLVYHDEKTLQKFVHALSALVRANPKSSALFMAVSGDEAKNLLTTMAQFCDKTIRI